MSPTQSGFLLTSSANMDFTRTGEGRTDCSVFVSFCAHTHITHMCIHRCMGQVPLILRCSLTHIPPKCNAVGITQHHL